MEIKIGKYYKMKKSVSRRFNKSPKCRIAKCIFKGDSDILFQFIENIDGHAGKGCPSQEPITPNAKPYHCWFLSSDDVLCEIKDKNSIILEML